jgi:hypothetical protein
MAQLKQIVETAKIARAGIGIPAGVHVTTMSLAPVRPLGRNERAATVRQAGHYKKNTAPAEAADDVERPTLERVVLSRDRHRIRKIPAMGSLSPLPSAAFLTPN